MKNINRRWLSGSKNVKYFFLTCVITLISMIGVNAQVTIANFDFNAAASYPVSATTTAVNVTASATSSEPFSTGNGTATDTSAFVTNATAGDGLQMDDSSGINTKYFEFTLGGSNLAFYASYQVYFQARRNPQGAQTVTLAYSTDCVNFTSFPTALTSGNASYNSIVLDLSGITALNNQSTVCFRLLASDAGGTGTLRIDNFQVQANLAPTAAPGTISGRARTSNGVGIKHAVVMLTGGDLVEPIYATTNQFGNYLFQDITVGESYVLQITSGRYTFQNPSRLVNLDDSITDEDFITVDFGGDSPTKRLKNQNLPIFKKDNSKKRQ